LFTGKYLWCWHGWFVFDTTNVKENIARDKISCAELLRKC